MPVFIYCALSVLPVGKLLNSPVKYSSYLLPGILAMTIMQGGIYGLAYWMVDMKSRGVIKRFMVTPLKIWQLVLSLVAARIVVVFAQVIILTLIGTLIFQTPFNWNILEIAALTILGAGIFLTLGLLISNFASSYETAAPITSAIGLPLTFLGNIFFPISSLPSSLQIFAKFLPITYLADSFRKAYLLPIGFSDLGKDILVLSLWLAGLVLLTIKVFKLKE